MLLLLACVAPIDTDTGAVSATETAATTETVTTETTPGTTETTPPVDRDGDGYTGDVDCDDAEETVHPGAEEIWNGWDDDCDDSVDADGYYEGTQAVSAVAIYEGQAHAFTLDCPVAAVRVEGQISVLVSCTPDPADDWAQLLLGAELSISVSEDIGYATEWTGTSTISSTNGWDTYGDGAITWPDLRSMTFDATLDAASLSLTSDGALIWLTGAKRVAP